MKSGDIQKVIKKTWEVARKNEIFDESAKLAFYFLLSLFPFLVVLLLILGLVLDQGNGGHDILVSSLSGVAPETIVILIDGILEDVIKGASSKGVWTAMLLSLWSASRAISALIGSLNQNYGVEETRKWWEKILVSLALTLGVAFLNVITFIIILFSGFFLDLFSKIPIIQNFDQVLWTVSQWSLLFFFVTFVTFIIYRFGPNKKGLKSRPLVAGTFLCVFLWLLLSYVFQFYLSHFNQFNRTYGSLSAVIVLLFWLYFSAAAILTGGALNSALIQKD